MLIICRRFTAGPPRNRDRIVPEFTLESRFFGIHQMVDERGPARAGRTARDVESACAADVGLSPSPSNCLLSCVDFARRLGSSFLRSQLTILMIPAHPSHSTVTP